MPTLKTYDLFLSHMWKNSDNSEYYRLVNLISQANNFSWRNYSVPEHDPLGVETDSSLWNALDRQIRPVNCFVIISGMYAAHRRWIQAELEIAQRYRKPIIGVLPQGQIRVPIEIQNSAHEIVGWNTDSITSAIRRWSL